MKGEEKKKKVCLLLVQKKEEVLVKKGEQGKLLNSKEKKIHDGGT